jgi:hypothetical protein
MAELSHAIAKQIGCEGREVKERESRSVEIKVQGVKTRAECLDWVQREVRSGETMWSVAGADDGWLGGW